MAMEMSAAAAMAVERPRRAARAGWLLLGSVLLLLLGLPGQPLLGAAKMAVLFLPGWWLLSLRIIRPALRRPAFLLWTVPFVVDAAVRGFLHFSYGAAPDSSLVLTSLANTHGDEALQYLEQHVVPVALASLLALAALTVLDRIAREILARDPGPDDRGLSWGLSWPQALLPVLLALGATASGPWRDMHPLAFWPQWPAQLAGTRAALRDAALEHQGWIDRAIRSGVAGPATRRHVAMLVITESINRDNLGLYGYARATSPALDRHRHELLVMRHAWSVAASTVPALDAMLRPTAADGSRQDLLALARAAGYRIHWISNHDDLAIRTRHGGLADEQVYINRVPGRSARTLDGELLPSVDRALADPAPLKLIVVHLLGAHPHYRYRYPEGQPETGSADDAVSAAMVEQGRWPWIRRFRTEYDTALRYHDGVLAALLKQLQSVPGDELTHKLWLAVSDHGQDVGHDRNHAGHSPMTPAGYRIPLLLWQSGHVPTPDAQALEQRPVRADWLADLLLPRLGITLPGADSARDALSDDYRWQPPVLPIAVANYLD